MKRKFMKYAMFSILFLLAIFSAETVHAEQYTGQAIWPSEYIPGVYIKKVKPDGYTKYQQGRFLRRSHDNKFVYCLQPYVDIDENSIKTDLAKLLIDNEEGEFITPYVLSSGQYKLEEVDQKIDGYLWNNESHVFYIDSEHLFDKNEEKFYNLSQLIKKRFIRSNYFIKLYRELVVGGNK